MIALLLKEEEYLQLPRLRSSRSSRSRQDLMEGVCVGTIKWPNPAWCGAATLLWGCPGVAAMPTHTHTPRGHTGRARGINKRRCFTAAVVFIY